MPDRRLKRVSVWNMKVGRGKAAIDGLCDLIEDQDPDAILLQEAMNYVRAIRREFREDWRVYSGTPFTTRANCPVMVRRNIKHGRKRGKDWGIVKVRHSWVYRGKGRFVRHPGRSWTWALADGVALLSMHRETEALGLNKASGVRSARRFRMWTAQFAEWFGAGDWNNLWSDRRNDSPADIAKTSGGELAIPADARIDFAVTSKGLVKKARRGKRYGSDHPSHYYDL